MRSAGCLGRGAAGAGPPALAIAVLGALGLATAAPARAQRVVLPTTTLVKAKLPESKGYSLSLTADGSGEVLVTARRQGGPGEIESATYAAAGRGGRNRIQADFGQFGRIDVRWTGNVRRRPPLRGCRGAPRVVGRGAFHGTIEFRGREGFAEARVARVPGGFQQIPREVCHLRGHPYAPPGGAGRRRVRSRGGRGLRTSALEAISLADGRELRFSVLEPGIGPITFFDATASELVEGVAITAATHSDATGEAATLGGGVGPPRRADVAPPAPFLGTASYRRPQTGPALWTGNLRVPLPGLGEVPLTGDRFRVRTCRRPFAALGGCTRRRPAS